MKKIIAMILTISSVLLLADCSSPTARYDTPHYSIIRTNGRCELLLTQSPSEDVTPSSVTANVALNVPKFSTVSEMRQAILSGSISKEHLETIHRICSREDGSAPIVDPDLLHEFTMPDDLNAKNEITFYGPRYSTSLSNDSNDDLFGYMRCYESTTYSEAFNSTNGYLAFLSNDKITLIRQETVEERSATIYYTSNSVCKMMYICYELQHGDKHIYVQEQYILETSDSDLLVSSTTPSKVSLWGRDGQGYFECCIHDPAERPSTQWLLEFGLTPLETDADI